MRTFIMIGALIITTNPITAEQGHTLAWVLMIAAVMDGVEFLKGVSK